MTLADEIKLSGNLGVATEGTSKGMGQTDGDPQYTASVEASRGGLYSGFKAFNVYTSANQNVETHIYAGHKGKVGAFGYNVFVVYRNQYGAGNGVDNDMVEIDATVSRKINKTTLKFRAIHSPDNFGAVEKAYWFEVGAAQKLSDKWQASVNVATRQNDDAPDYMAWNYGVSYSLTENLSADLRYYDTDKHHRGERYEGRTIFGLTQKF